MKNQKKEYEIDYIKVWHIIFVMLGHIDQGANCICNWIYSFHIPIFYDIRCFN